MTDDRKGLRFPCECVSGLPGGYTDPWADVTKRKLLPNGTKEQIITLVANEPKTLSQLAQALLRTEFSRFQGRRVRRVSNAL